MIETEGKSLFCKNRGLSGEAGAISLWCEVSYLALDLFTTLEFRNLLIENSAHDRVKYRRQTLDLLELKPVEEKLCDPTYEKYCGRFSGIAIHIEGDRPCTDLGWQGPSQRLKLLPIGQDEFEFEAFPGSMKFIGDRNGGITSLELTKALFCDNTTTKMKRIK